MNQNSPVPNSAIDEWDFFSEGLIKDISDNLSLLDSSAEEEARSRARSVASYKKANQRPILITGIIVLLLVLDGILAVEVNGYISGAFVPLLIVLAGVWAYAHSEGPKEKPKFSYPLYVSAYSLYPVPQNEEVIVCPYCKGRSRWTDAYCAHCDGVGKRNVAPNLYSELNNYLSEYNSKVNEINRRLRDFNQIVS
jgi:hypothetical protein